MLFERFVSVVLSVMYVIDVMAWNEREVEQGKVGQNKVTRMTLNEPRCAVLEFIKEDGMEYL